MKNKMTKAQIAVGVLLLGVVGVALYQADVASKVSYKSTTATSTVEYVEPVEEVDVIDEAKAELERINAQLDAEETKLLEQKAAIEAEKAAELKAVEERLEQIRETRTSFR